MNLWWPAGFAEDGASAECVFSAGASDIGASVFVGNAMLVGGILVGLFLFHVAIVSGAEAYWLAKVSSSKYSFCWFAAYLFLLIF